MATTKKPETVTAAILMDCVFGKAGEVVTLSAADAANGIAAGMLDPHPDAVAALRG